MGGGGASDERQHWRPEPRKEGRLRKIIDWQFAPNHRSLWKRLLFLCDRRIKVHTHTRAGCARHLIMPDNNSTQQQQEKKGKRKWGNDTKKEKEKKREILWNETNWVDCYDSFMMMMTDRYFLFKIRCWIDRQEPGQEGKDLLPKTVDCVCVCVWRIQMKELNRILIVWQSIHHDLIFIFKCYSFFFILLLSFRLFNIFQVVQPFWL